MKKMEYQFYRKLGDKIRDRRLELHVSCPELAKKIGITRQMMNYIEDGLRKPTDEIFDCICKELEISNSLEVNIKIGL